MAPPAARRPCLARKYSSAPRAAPSTRSIGWQPKPTGPTATPAADNATSAELPANEDVTVTHTYTIHCTEPSEHTFTFNNSIAVDQLHFLDPDTSNNADSDTHRVIITAKADVKLAQSVEGPSGLQVSEDGTVTVTKTLHLSLIHI